MILKLKNHCHIIKKNKPNSNNTSIKHFILCLILKKTHLYLGEKNDYIKLWTNTMEYQVQESKKYQIERQFLPEIEYRNMYIIIIITGNLKFWFLLAFRLRKCCTLYNIFSYETFLANIIMLIEAKRKLVNHELNINLYFLWKMINLNKDGSYLKVINL